MKFAEAYQAQSSKHVDYYSIYDDIFFGNRVDRMGEYNILEIGVDGGHGLRALKKYFPNSKICGLDILPECKKEEEDGIEVVIGSQVDQATLHLLASKQFDIIIDDGSHDNNHVFDTFCELFPSLRQDKAGLYIIEDTHTSYWPYYNGGYRDENSTIEKFKSIIDACHAWCIRDSRPNQPHTNQLPIPTTWPEEWVKFTQFYENIVVVKKRLTRARCSHPI